MIPPPLSTGSVRYERSIRTNFSYDYGHECFATGVNITHDYTTKAPEDPAASGASARKLEIYAPHPLAASLHLFAALLLSASLATAADDACRHGHRPAFRRNGFSGGDESPAGQAAAFLPASSHQSQTLSLRERPLTYSSPM